MQEDNRMNRITEFVGGPELLWTKPDWRTLRYELHHDGACVATLGFRSATGSFATAESGDGCWTFKRTGFLQTRATVRRCGKYDDLAAFDHGVWTTGGVVVLPDGRRYRADTNLWSTRFAIATEAGEPLVRYRVTLDGMQVSSVMAIEARARNIEEIPWIAMLGWYIAAQADRDSALRGVGNSAWAPR